MPAFAFSGDTASSGTSTELYRVYVATDSDCVNVVFRGAIVGSPAYAPRWNGTLALPSTIAAQTASRTQFASAGAEGLTSMADSTPVTANEAMASSASTDDHERRGRLAGERRHRRASEDTTTAVTRPAAFPAATLAVDPGSLGPPIDLWDTDWPTGRYYWTVVPVAAQVKSTLTTSLGATAAAGATTVSIAAGDQLAVGDVLTIGTGPAQESVTVVTASSGAVTVSPALANAHGAGDTVLRSGGELTYRDLELPQDACAAGRVLTFGKTSQPTLASATSAPFASGLSPTGRLTSASKGKRSFYGSPLVSWQPALGASAYEVQWSKTRYPFVTVTTPILTYGTSALLPLQPGKWWYRVRGINLALPAGARAMAWSKRQPLVVAKPTFASSSRQSSRSSDARGRANGALVDRVAREPVELIREEVRRRRRLARRRVDLPSVDVHADERLRGLVLESDVVAEPRAKPAREQQRLRPRRPHRDLARLERIRTRASS